MSIAKLRLHRRLSLSSASQTSSIIVLLCLFLSSTLHKTRQTRRSAPLLHRHFLGVLTLTAACPPSACDPCSTTTANKDSAAGGWVVPVSKVDILRPDPQVQYTIHSITLQHCTPCTPCPAPAPLPADPRALISSNSPLDIQSTKYHLELPTSTAAVNYNHRLVLSLLPTHPPAMGVEIVTIVNSSGKIISNVSTFPSPPRALCHQLPANTPHLNREESC